MTSTDGREIKKGDICLFQYNGFCMVGEYDGLNISNVVKFKSVIAGTDRVTYFGADRIEKIYKVNITMGKESEYARAENDKQGIS